MHQAALICAAGVICIAAGCSPGELRLTSPEAQAALATFASEVDRVGLVQASHNLREVCQQRGDALACLACDGPCREACPHRVNVPAHLMKAHALLSLA